MGNGDVGQLTPHEAHVQCSRLTLSELTEYKQQGERGLGHLGSLLRLEGLVV